MNSFGLEDIAVGVQCEHALDISDISKHALLNKLSSLMPSEEVNDFLEICRHLEHLIRVKNRDVNDELIVKTLELYSWLDPSAENIQITRELWLEKQNRFLDLLLKVLVKCRFKILSDKEWKLATSSTYLFHLPAKLNSSELDGSIFENFTERFEFELPSYCEKKFLVFRRGIGVDECNGYFFKAKIDEVFSRMWKKTFGNVWKWMRNEADHSHASHYRPFSKAEGSEYETVKRVHVKNSFKLKNFFERLHLQEPTFDRMVLISSPKRSHLKIHLKNYKSIPMADMELILPEKKSPRLPTSDWIFLFLSALLASVLLLKSYNDHHPHRIGIGLIFGIIAAFLSYCAKVYYTFNQNLLEYERLIGRLMQDKQLDCGHGALLHVCEEAIQLEVKEVIIAYFLLREKGELSDKEVCTEYKNFLKTHLNIEEHVDEKFALGVQNKGAIRNAFNGKLRCMSLNEIIPQIISNL